MSSKRFIISIVIISYVLSNSFASFAHPGKTDANGGHYNRSTGEYHYHHGYSAHNHTNGKCPYDFDDQTNHEPNTSKSSSSGISNSSNSTTSNNRITAGSSAKKYIKNQTDSIILTEPNNNKHYIPIALIIVLCVAFIIHKINNKKKKYIPPLIRAYDNINIPPGYTLNHKGLPIRSDVAFENSEYAVYVTLNGTRYHKKHCKVISHSKAQCIHVFDRQYITYFKLEPCSLCKPYIIKENWYKLIVETAYSDLFFYRELETDKKKRKEFIKNRIKEAKTKNR